MVMRSAVFGQCGRLRSAEAADRAEKRPCCQARRDGGVLRRQCTSLPGVLLLLACSFLGLPQACLHSASNAAVLTRITNDGMTQISLPACHACHTDTAAGTASQNQMRMPQYMRCSVLSVHDCRQQGKVYTAGCWKESLGCSDDGSAEQRTPPEVDGGDHEDGRCCAAGGRAGAEGCPGACGRQAQGVPAPCPQLARCCAGGSRADAPGSGYGRALPASGLPCALVHMEQALASLLHSP